MHSTLASEGGTVLLGHGMADSPLRLIYTALTHPLGYARPNNQGSTEQQRRRQRHHPFFGCSRESSQGCLHSPVKFDFNFERVKFLFGRNAQDGEPFGVIDAEPAT